MSYPHRLFTEGYWYHVYSSGQRGQPLFFAPSDRITYLNYLDKELSRRGGKVGSYCLMTNHVHMLVLMENEPLSNIFQTVHMSYAKYFNNKRETAGHVFQGRPGMKIVLSDRYLLGLVSYIHKNPVKAKIVEKVTDYKWSSWKWFTSGIPPEIKSGLIPPGFNGKRTSSVFNSVINEESEVPEGDFYWGEDSEWGKFKEGMDEKFEQSSRIRRGMDEIAENITVKTGYTISDLKGRSQERNLSKVRRNAMAAMYEEGYGSTEIGSFFNRTPGSVTHSYRLWKSSK